MAALALLLGVKTVPLYDVSNTTSPLVINYTQLVNSSVAALALLRGVKTVPLYDKLIISVSSRNAYVYNL